MTNYKYDKGLYKCSEEAFYKKIDNLREMVRIYKSAKYSEVDKAYQLFKIYNSVSEFDKKYRLLLENGSNDPVVGENYEYIKLISDLLKRYKEKGYEKDFYDIRTLERKLDDYEEAKNIIFAYIESNLFEDEHIFDELGITSLEFYKCVRKVECLAPNLYKQYLAEREGNFELKYNDMISNFKDIANAIENGCFKDGTEFSMLEFWARVPLKVNVKKDFEDYCQKTKKYLFGFGNNFVSRVINFTKFVLPVEQHNTILNFLRNNHITNTSNAMTLTDLKIRYNGIKRIVINSNDGAIIDFNFTIDDFNNIIDYIMLRRLPLILEIYENVQLEYIKGNITIDTINELRNSSKKSKVLNKK